MVIIIFSSLLGGLFMWLIQSTEDVDHKMKKLSYALRGSRCVCYSHLYWNVKQTNKLLPWISFFSSLLYTINEATILCKRFPWMQTNLQERGCFSDTPVFLSYLKRKENILSFNLIQIGQQSPQLVELLHSA